MPLETESLYQKLGGLELPVMAGDVSTTLTPLDPGRDLLLDLFASAINSELSDAWNVVVSTLGTASPYYGKSPVEYKLPEEPTESVLTQLKTSFPILALHRNGTATYEGQTMEVVKLVQPWKLYYILGAVDVIGLRKLKDVCVAVAKIVSLVIRQRGHRSYQDGALQFFSDTSAFTSIRTVSHEGPDQAVYAGDKSSVIFWAIEINLETTETSSDVEGAYGNLDAEDITVAVGGEELIPEFIKARTDPETPFDP